MARFSLSALGVDRPGIVAAVSEVLAAVGGNLEDSTMTILQGHFAILLIVSVADDMSQADLEAALVEVGRRFDLVLAVRPLAHAPVGGTEPGEPWTVSVHGSDRTGIVHGISAALAGVGGNVVDLSTHLVGESDAPVYVMTLRVTLPSGSAAVAAAEAVRTAAEALGVHCVVHRDESDTL
jgi:glycine cleavage system transcriptional repressor